MKLIRGHLWHPLSRSEWQSFEDGALVITDNGRVEAVGEYQSLSRQYSNAAIQDFSGSLIIPGMIDAHTHLPQLPIRGMQAGTLLQWLEHYAFPVEERFADKTVAELLSARFFGEMAAAGTTTALVLSSVHRESTDIAFAAAEDSGLRVAMGKVMMNQNSPVALTETAQASLADSEALAKRWHGAGGGLLHYAFTPRFALSCSPEVLEGAGDLHRRFTGSYLQSHLSENESEIDAVTALFEYRYNYTEIYDRFGCLGPNTVMAHGIHLSPAELELIKATGTRVAHCPTSNFFLKSGFFNRHAFETLQIPYALGSDVGAGYDLCMFGVMRAMDEVQLHHRQSVSPVEAFYQATLGGADALNLSDETGNFAVGKSADFVVVDLTDFTRMDNDAQPVLGYLSQLMYRGNPNLIRQTVVRGETVYTRREDTSASLQKVVG